MTENHPITPPPELVQQWLGEYFGCTVSGELNDSQRYLATASAQWGADWQLEECVAWLEGFEREGWAAMQMRNDCRPKPPSLKEQALAVLDDVRAIDATHYNILRNALEQLPND